MLPLMPLPEGDEQNGHDPHSYKQTLKVRLAELRDLVECRITQEAQRQKDFYDGATKSRSFTVGDAVWLQVPTAGKLEARWEGGWTVKEVLSTVNVTIEHIKTARTRVVHVNRLQRLVRGEVEALGEPQSGAPVADWEAPHIEHFVLPQQQAEIGRHYPQCVRYPVV